jgi:hypothetical protein
MIIGAEYNHNDQMWHIFFTFTDFCKKVHTDKFSSIKEFKELIKLPFYIFNHCQH